MIKYKNGNYNVYLFNDGTKIRYTKDTMLQPDRPESLDVALTEKCKMMCNFCYANCTPNGQHAILFDDNGKPVYWLSTVKPYTELAINGNDMDHPQLEQFLTYCKNHKIIVNITLHQQQFINNYTQIYNYKKNNLINGIGISISNTNKQIISLIKYIPDTVCHVIAGIVDEKLISNLIDNDLNILILGYKNKGRGIGYNTDNSNIIKNNIEWLVNNIITYTNKFKAISFDCLACEQLCMKDKMSKDEWNKLYMGADGTTTFYIDAVNNKFAKSSTETTYHNIDNRSIEEMFNFILNE